MRLEIRQKNETAGDSRRSSLASLRSPAYLQAGAPSEFAMLFGSVGKFTNTEQVTTGVVRLTLVAVAFQAPPGAGAATTTVFPIVGQKFSLFAAHVPLLVTLIPSAYRTESAKNPS